MLNRFPFYYYYYYLLFIFLSAWSHLIQTGSRYWSNWDDGSLILSIPIYPPSSLPPLEVFISLLSSSWFKDLLSYFILFSLHSSISSFIPHQTLILFTSLLPLPSRTHTPPFHPFFLYIHSSTPLLPLLLLLHIEGELVYFYFPIRLCGTSTTSLDGLFLLPHTSPRRIQQLVPLRANKDNEP